MNEIQVHNIDGKLFADSRWVAEVLGVEHESLVKVCRVHENSMGILRFEIGKISGRGHPEKFILLTERQSLIALTLVRNTDQAVLEPKANFTMPATASKDAVDLGTVAKVLDMGIGRNTLFELLRKHGVLMENNQPYQKFVDSRCFRMIETSFQNPDGSTHVNIKTVAYQKGVELCRRVIEREMA